MTSGASLKGFKSSYLVMLNLLMVVSQTRKFVISETPSAWG